MAVRPATSGSALPVYNDINLVVAVSFFPLLHTLPGRSRRTLVGAEMLRPLTDFGLAGMIPTKRIETTECGVPKRMSSKAREA